MQKIPFTKKRIALGIVFIIAGFVILDRNSFWRGFQAPFTDHLPFLSIIFVGCSTVVLGGAVMLGMPAQEFLKGVLVFGLWTFAIVLPILLLQLPEEVTVLAFSFSGLFVVLLIVYYERLRVKHKKSIEKEQE